VNVNDLIEIIKQKSFIWGGGGASLLYDETLHAYLLHGSVLLEKLTGSAASKEIPAFLEPEGSSPYS
jgi:hypothetical protein